MPTKLNKAGKQQEYIPAGNGDPSGEYGTSKGTNKNFTTSDKKSSKANVITENKSLAVENKEWLRNKIDETAKKKAESDEKNSTKNVYGTEEERDKEGAKKLGVSLEEYKKMKEQHKKEMADIFEDKVENKGKTERLTSERYLTPDEWKKVYDLSKETNKKFDKLVDEVYKLQDKYDYDTETAINKVKEKYNSNKANIIDNDLTGKKERAYDGSEYKSMTKEETQSIIDKLEKAGFVKDTSYSGGRTYKIYDKDTGNWNKISFSEDGKLFGTTINKGVYGYADLDTAIDRATYKSGKAPSDKAIGWETGAYDSKVYDAYSRKHTKYDD